MPTIANYVGHNSTAPARKRVVWTGANQNLVQPCRGVIVNVAGAIMCQLADETADIATPTLAAGIVHPLAIRTITLTGTTATGITFVY